jgi:ADP-ribose pyrophosphatase YjhB (NUDIX family)
VFYLALKKLVGVFFNVLNVLLLGNLPPFGTVCLIIEQDEQYLVIKRPEGPVVLPGGFMRWHECSAQTAQREGKEETGLDLEIGEIIDTYTTTDRNFTRMSTLTIVHRATVIGGTLHSSIEGRPLWVNKEMLSQLLGQHYQTVVRDFLSLS